MFPGFGPLIQNYTEVPNDLIDALLKLESITEMKILLYLARRNGGGKIPFTEIEQATGISYLDFLDGVNDAIAHEYITVVSDSRHSIYQLYRKREPYPPSEQHHRSSPKSPRSGWLYVVKCQDRYKIGRTIDLNRRLLELTKQVPFPLSLVHKSHHADINTIERSVHTKYEDQNIMGEWFKLTEGDLEWLKTL